MNYKILITTSSIGARLGDLTKYTNKALLRVGKKPAISYIIESYPADAPLVITLGHFGEQVRDFVGLAYPERKVEFVEVDKYSGEGSSLGYSMLCAEDKLQCPFIYHACDTLVTEPIPDPEYNWIGVRRGGDATEYASWNMLKDVIAAFNDKGAVTPDYVHIGLVGIQDYENYWKTLKQLYRENPNDGILNDCAVIVKMLQNKALFRLAEFYDWRDTGNLVTLRLAREQAGDHFDNLDKADESIFVFPKFVIKFFADEKTAKNRVIRAKNLHGLVPDIEGETKNFYRYKFVDGELYARVVSPEDFQNFLHWAKENLWKPAQETSPEEFRKICLDFYESKTKKRIKKFFEENSTPDSAETINGDNVPAINEVLAKVDFARLADAEQRQFHGDFILDNIIRTAGGYCLLDWRQDFGGLLRAGDMYYDLAKLAHNLVVNHDMVHKNLFTVSNNAGAIACDIQRKPELADCEKILFDFLEKEGYDAEKVKILRGLIWLNMSPLHHYPFNVFLYYFGKWNLWRTITKH